MNSRKKNQMTDDPEKILILVFQSNLDNFSNEWFLKRIKVGKFKSSFSAFNSSKSFLPNSALATKMGQTKK